MIYLVGETIFLQRNKNPTQASICEGRIEMRLERAQHGRLF